MMYATNVGTDGRYENVRNLVNEVQEMEVHGDQPDMEHFPIPYLDLFGSLINPHSNEIHHLNSTLHDVHRDRERNL